VRIFGRPAVGLAVTTGVPAVQHAKRAERPKMQPPMTPMIDCTFNLLVFFILAPSLALSEGFLTTNLPRSGPGPVPPDPPPEMITIGLFDEAGGQGVSIVLGGTQALGSSFPLLRAALQDMRARGVAADTPILISPTMATRHKWVVSAFDAAVAARFADIRFAVPYQ
jgi:biopolymer transport protein ExbD